VVDNTLARRLQHALDVQPIHRRTTEHRAVAAPSD
jgi:hypothetical protein